MLKLKICGQAVDLPLDTEFTINCENPIFTENRTPSSYTYPFRLVRSKRNLRLLGRPERITASAPSTEFPCEILFNERLLDSGVFVIEECGEYIEGYFRGASSDNNFDKPLNAINLGFDDEGQKFSDYYCMSADRDDDKTVVFAPIKLSGDITRAGALNKWRNYLNYYVTNQHILRDTLPAIRLGWLLDAIFAGTLKVNPFRSADYRHVVLQTLGRKGWSYPNLLEYTSFEDYLPDMEASKLLQNILKIFCASITVKRNEYQIIFNRDLFGNVEQVDWSNKLIDGYRLSREKGRGYKFGYNSEKRDVAADGHRNLITFFLLRWVEGETSPSGNQYLITNYGQVVERVFNYEAESFWRYNIINSGFGSNSEEKAGVYDSTSDIMPLDMTFNHILNTEDGATKSEIFCPQIDVGSIGNESGLRIMLWQKMQDSSTTGKLYPYLSAYNFNGLFLSESPINSNDFDLTWSGEHGLIEKFHKDFRAWLEKDKLVLKGNVLLTQEDIEAIDWLKEYHILGRDFYLRRYHVPISLRRIAPVEVELIEK